MKRYGWRTIVNETELTEGQETALYAALDAFAEQMRTPGALGRDEHGEAMRTGYLARVGELKRIVAFARER